MQQQLESLASELRRAKRVLFITGAGISADSGLPTYRGVGGLYNSGQTEEGYPIEQCLSASMFRVRPDITWKYMRLIGEAVLQCQPNPAHKIIAKWEKEFAQRGTQSVATHKSDGGTRSVVARKSDSDAQSVAARKSDGDKVVVFTQNIDGYHRLAGSENVLEIHGSMEELHCTKCAWEVNNSRNEYSVLFAEDSVPKCPECGAVIRPRIVMFEEMLPRPVLMQFQEEFDSGNGFDIVFSIGTSAMFPYITGPMYEAIRCGKTTVEINPAKGELSHRVAYYLPMGAADVLTKLDVLMSPCTR